MGYGVVRANTQPSVPLCPQGEATELYRQRHTQPGAFYYQLDVSDEPLSVFSGLRYHSTVAIEGLNKGVQSSTPPGVGQAQLSIEDCHIGAKQSYRVS